jgi:hypothetical protein
VKIISSHAFYLILGTGLKFSIVMFDVDNKDTSLGMSCPPKEFVSEDVIADVKKILSQDGKPKLI